MRVVVAPDKYKGCLTAAEVAAHLAIGLHAAAPGSDIVTCPVADGGDGFLAAAVAAGYRLQSVAATGPTGEPVTASYALLNEVAVVELAEICGLSRLSAGRLYPLTATSYGVGEVLAATLDQHVGKIVLGIGGSASTDGGAGMLAALGAEICDSSGASLALGGAALADVASISTRNLHSGLHGTELVIASDVTNPLTGPDGAAAVFGPQKGASQADIVLLEKGLRQWSAVVAAATGSDLSTVSGAGAAGGVGFAAIAVLGATLRAGIELMLDLAKFTELLKGACLVITGEGSIDAQTMSGKAPSGVARMAADAGVPVIAVAGQCTLGPDEIAQLGIRQVYTLTELEPTPLRSMADARILLEATALRIVREWLTE